VNFGELIFFVQTAHFRWTEERVSVTVLPVKKELSEDDAREQIMAVVLSQAPLQKLTPDVADRHDHRLEIALDVLAVPDE
jgi:hypothetical protein